jgi:hypothetical protein
VARASRVLVSTAEALLDEPEGQAAVLCVGAGATLDEAVATAVAATLIDEGVPARVAARPHEAGACRVAALVLARHGSPRRVRRGVARLRLAVGPDVPVLVVAEGAADLACVATAADLQFTDPETIHRALGSPASA